MENPEFYRTLIELCLEGLGCKDPEEFLKRVADRVSEVLGADFYKVLRFEGEDTFYLKLHRGLNGFENIEVRGNTKALHTLREGKAVFSEDFRTEGRFEIPEFMREAGARSGISIPIMVGGRDWGVIGFMFRERREFSDEEIEFLEEVSRVVSRFLEGAELSFLQSLLLEKSPYVLYLVEAEPPNPLRLIYLSPNAERIMGWSPEDVGPEWWIENVHPEDRERVLRNVERLMREGELIHSYRFRRKDGNYIWIQAYAKVIDRIKETYRIAGYWTDITEIKEQQELFETLVKNSPAAIFIYGERFIYANPAALELTGYSLEEFQNMHVWDVVHPKHREEVREVVRRRVNCDRVPILYTDLVVITKDGRERVARLFADTVRFRGRCYGLAVGIDITHERELEEELRREKERYELILSNLTDLVLVVDEEGEPRYVSPALERMLGFRPEELSRERFFELVHPEDREKLISVHGEVFRNPGRIFTLQHRVRDREGRYRWVESRVFLPENWRELGLEGAIVSERDITDRIELQERLLRVTYYDTLTGLPNRLLFLEKLRETLDLARRRREMVGVAVLNVHRFREVNASYGIKVGDEVLREIGRRLSRTLRGGDIVSRFMADEFGLGLTGIRNLSGLNRAVEKVREAFREPIEVDGKEIYLEVNLGVSLFPRDGEGAEDLVRKAELALSDAREAGPGSVAFFSEEVEREITQMAILKASLREAIRNNEIVPYYQPVFRLSDLRLVGVEALARWEHPQMGTIPPSRFIPIAEDTGLILELGQSMLNQAVRDLSLLHSEGYLISLGVNFSMRQFMDEELPTRIEEVLRSHNFREESFILEITESTAMREPERTKEILGRMRELGVKVAIDDFGTGYSSMNYLLEFEVDKIKIDKSFIIPVLENERAERVVSTIVKLSSSLNALSLAEGVENEDILRKLREVGCDEGQGYYFAPPMKFEQLREFVKGKTQVHGNER